MRVLFEILVVLPSALPPSPASLLNAAPCTFFCTKVKKEADDDSSDDDKPISQTIKKEKKIVEEVMRGRRYL